MIKTQLHCELLSPMFSNGADKNTPELRASELKGLIRFIFRLCQVGEDCKTVEELRNKENKLFGDAEKMASPIKLSMLMEKKAIDGNSQIVDQNLVMHKSIKVPAFKTKTAIKIELRTKGCVLREQHEKYVLLTQFALLLGGMGKRMRRGRGSLVVKRIESDIDLLNQGDCVFSKPEQLLNFICQTLNNPMLSGEGAYKLDENQIVPVNVINRKYPYIERIVLSDGATDINSILKKIDDASHVVNATYPSIYTGYAILKNIYNNGKIIWKKGDKMSSSLIVSPVKIGKNIHLLYTFIKPIFENKTISSLEIEKKDHRNSFKKLVEDGK